MKVIYLGKTKEEFVYNSMGELREEAKKYGIVIGNDVSVGDFTKISHSAQIGNFAEIGKNICILERAKVPEKANITEIYHINGAYKYQVSGYFVDSVPYVQMG